MIRNDIEDVIRKLHDTLKKTFRGSVTRKLRLMLTNAILFVDLLKKLT